MAGQEPGNAGHCEQRPAAEAGGWRALIARHALRIRAAAGDTHERGAGVLPACEMRDAERAVLEEALGPMAEEALRIVESYALGAPLAGAARRQ